MKVKQEEHIYITAALPADCIRTAIPMFSEENTKESVTSSGNLN